MEKTLREIYENLIPCKDKWSYYEKAPYLSYNTLFSENDSLDFIKQYFSCGSKVVPFKDKYIGKKSDIIKKRAPHIVSTYLLGIIIAESFNLDLWEKNKEGMNLMYLWFLSCLYHDIGYIYEETPCCKHLREIQTNGLTALRKICNIKYFTEDAFRTYAEKEINLYLSYRAKCSDGKMGVIDHGIAGGLTLYDRLIKNYEQAWKEKYGNRKHNENCTNEPFCHNGLHFSTEHFHYYEKAADAIISHNIWADTLKKCLEDKGEDYEQAPMIQEENKIAFILALADTIEPIKKYGPSALNKIKFKETGNGFDWIMPAVDNKDEYKYLKDLPNWVEITVNDVTNDVTKNTFSIKIKGSE